MKGFPMAGQSRTGNWRGLTWWYLFVCVTSVCVSFVLGVVYDFVLPAHQIHWHAILKHALFSGTGLGITLALLLRPRPRQAQVDRKHK